VSGAAWCPARAHQTEVVQAIPARHAHDAVARVWGQDLAKASGKTGRPDLVKKQHSNKAGSSSSVYIASSRLLELPKPELGW